MKYDTKGITKVSGRARGGGRGDAAAGQAGTGPSPTTAPAQQQADERVSTPVSARVLVLSLHHHLALGDFTSSVLGFTHQKFISDLNFRGYNSLWLSSN